MSADKGVRKNRFRDGLAKERESVAQIANPISTATASRFEKADSVFGDVGIKTPPQVVSMPLSLSLDENFRQGRIKALLSKVHNNPWNARRIYESDKVASMAASIKADGQIYPCPAVAHPEKPGEWILIDGHYRRKGIELNGESEIWLQIVEATTPKEMYRLSRTLNEERSENSALDNALAWRDLLEKGVYKDGEELGQSIGISKTAVSKELSLLKMPNEVLEIIQDNPSAFSSSSAYELYLSVAVLPGEGLLELARRISNEKLSKREVIKAREKLASSATRRTREISRQYKLRDGDEMVGTIREWDSGRVSLDITLLDASKRAALVELLRSKFGMESQPE